MSANRWDPKAKKPPKGFNYLVPVLSALENELRDKVRESNAGKRNTESMWPVHQINWQRSRYVYDMYYTHGKITKKVYDYCIKNKLVDAALIAKWKKPGYERLCSTYVINPNNYKFGTTSICRVPLKDRSPEAKTAQDPTTGCRDVLGSGAASEYFWNKYGQNLAAVQVAREKRMEEMEQKRLREEEANSTAAAASAAAGGGDSETDDDSDDDDDYGPTPAAWASEGGKLEAESERLAEGGDDTDDYKQPAKKLKSSS
ncbi:BUD31 (G10) family protein [Skeletonema marinoi]|uniref:BUD31 (G10) family protein n=1 Tax=Skeletonema marinoi TaxID=267567 RepID=A0AAD8YC73_9STRA|nr:BUD31 (G10) family protein [Skeletonema marinoi]